MISISILKAIVYIHSLKPPIIHRDIKGGNIYLSDNGEPILGDFGLSYKAINNDTNFRTACGTPLWAPPEILEKDNSNFSRKCDIWSFGCTVLEMIVGSDPWRGQRNNQSRSPPIPNNLTQECQDVLKLALNYDQSLRPKSKNLLKASWFNETPSIPFSNFKKAIDSDEIIDSFKKFGLKFIVNFVENPFNYESQFFCLAFSKKIPETMPMNEEDELVKKCLEPFKTLKKYLPFQIQIGNYVLDLNREFDDFKFLKNNLLFMLTQNFSISSDDGDILQLTIHYIVRILVYQTIIYRPERFKII